MKDSIHSERLDLVPLNPAVLRALLRHDLLEAERILGMPLPDGLLDSCDVFALRLEQLETDSAYRPWSLRAIALREPRRVIGHIGFHTGPAPEYLRPIAPGGVEFGFTVYPPFQRQGYAHEASKALMDWARQVHGVTRFVLSIRPDNAPSQALAAKLGFVRIGSHIDEVDGPEDILELNFAPMTPPNSHRSGQDENEHRAGSVLI
jgi:RimJ/RimL family protein N-acetyltransferase